MAWSLIKQEMLLYGVVLVQYRGNNVLCMDWLRRTWIDSK